MALVGGYTTRDLGGMTPRILRSLGYCDERGRMTSRREPALYWRVYFASSWRCGPSDMELEDGTYFGRSTRSFLCHRVSFFYFLIYPESKFHQRHLKGKQRGMCSDGFRRRSKGGCRFKKQRIFLCPGCLYPLHLRNPTRKLLMWDSYEA